MKKSDALKFYKNANRLAKAIGISRQSVSEWPKIVPFRKALRLVELTKGKKGALKLDPQDYA